ncbi:MAG: hypothetical protein Q8S17_01580, partial [Humidesulfovibrio sp.]|nr:hypothetical protein [Humidesulfovibrio sp.]
MQQKRRPQPIAIAMPVPRTAPGHLVILAALIALIIALTSQAHAFNFFGGPKEVKAKASAVTLPLSEVSDGKAHFYTYKTGGKNVQ